MKAAELAADTPGTRVISTCAELEDLCARAPDLPTRPMSFEVGLSEPERTRWEARVNQYATACGCGAATIGLTLGAAVALWWVLWTQTSGVLARVLIVVAAAIASMAIGKVLGLAYAKARIRRTCCRLAREIWGSPARLEQT